MAHEIEKHDNVVLHKQAAWHGLGIIVEDAPTPREALKIAGLDWDVVQYPLIAQKDEKTGIMIPKHVANFRADTDIQLGIVGRDYMPIQNAELADFCEALAEGGDVVRCETAGSIRNGQRVWFLLKGESFSVRKKDEITPYICVSNGHDGWTALRCTPTTVRVVCSNTLHMVIPGKENEGRTTARPAAFATSHTRLIKDRIEEAKTALQLYGRALDTTREYLDVIAAKECNEEKLKQFFAQCYTADFGAIPLQPKDTKEHNALHKARMAYAGMKMRFEAEQKLAGATLWNAMNAYTGWLQHDNVSHIKDEVKAAEAKIQSQLWGTNADRAHHALTVALALAG
jgi:phage/plasmid-like protein (TIGR03299 family)